jgi:hypothetical protein
MQQRYIAPKVGQPQRKELASAVEYLVKGFYAIPDSVEEIGLADDEIIVRRITERNPELAPPTPQNREC